MLIYSPGGPVDIWTFLRLSRRGESDGKAWSAKVRRSQPRTGAAPSQCPKSVQDRRTIASLIVVAAALLDSELRGGAFTFEQLLRKMGDLLGRDRTLDVVDVHAVLPAMDHCLARSHGGWRWKQRCRKPVFDGP